MSVPTSLRTSDRASLLSFMGLPLQLFGKGSFFGPYTPLQQFGLLSDSKTMSYVAGSTNSLLLLQSSRYCDVFVNLDEHSVDVFKLDLRVALTLSVADRRFIDFLTKTVNETWDPEHPSRPADHGYVGSEDFIRLQFEEYLLAMVSCAKYQKFVKRHGNDPKALLSDLHGDPANDFGAVWVESWQQTDNYRLFDKFTDSHLFDVVEPRHPTAGALSVEDIQRRVAQQVAELHLDERFSTGKEAIGKQLASGQKKVSAAFNSLWADIETMREAQRKRSADLTAAQSSSDPTPGKAAEPTASRCKLLSASHQRVQADADTHSPQEARSVTGASKRAGDLGSSWGLSLIVGSMGSREAANRLSEELFSCISPHGRAKQACCHHRLRA